MKQLEKLTDKQLAATAKEIAALSSGDWQALMSARAGAKVGGLTSSSS